MSGRRFIPTVIGALVLAIGVGALLYTSYIHQKNMQTDKDFAALKQRIPELDSLRQYDLALTQLTAFLPRARTKAQQTYVSDNIAAQYVYKNNPRQARDWYLKAIKYQGKADLVELNGMTVTSIALNDKPAAIEYAKKLIVVYRATPDVQNIAQADSIQHRIEILEGGQ